MREWVQYLKNERLWGNDDPLFPKTEVKQGSNQTFTATSIKQEHWKTASPIHKIFKEAFETADLPYFNPHSFRSTQAELGEKVCQSPEEFKTWSQNLGHEKVMTTSMSYGEVQANRQAEIIQQLGLPCESANHAFNADEFSKAVARKMKEEV